MGGNFEPHSPCTLSTGGPIRSVQVCRSGALIDNPVESGLRCFALLRDGLPLLDEQREPTVSLLLAKVGLAEGGRGVFLRNLDEDQTLIVYVCAGRMCGLGRETEVTVFQPQPSKASDPLSNAILGSLCAESGASKLFGQANTIKKNLFGEDGSAGNDLFRVTRYICDNEEGRADAGPERDAAIAAAKKLFTGDPAKSRMALLELVDTALTIITSNSSRPPDELVSEANKTLDEGRQENDNINFVLGFAEEALLPNSMRLADFVSASAALITTSLQVADFVDTGEAPWRSKEGESSSNVGGSQDLAEDEATEDCNGGQDDTAPAVEGS